MSPSTDPIKFVDLPEDLFPFTVEFFRLDTDEVVHRVTVDGPGALHIPGLGPGHGVRITYPDGFVSEDRSPD